MFLVELTFAYKFFCLEATLEKDNSDETDFRQCYGNIFERAIPKNKVT